MLERHAAAGSALRPAERALLGEQLAALGRCLDPGLARLNWASLTIPDFVAGANRVGSFILRCGRPGLRAGWDLHVHTTTLCAHISCHPPTAHTHGLLTARPCPPSYPLPGGGPV